MARRRHLDAGQRSHQGGGRIDDDRLQVGRAADELAGLAAFALEQDLEAPANETFTEIRLLAAQQADVAQADDHRRRHRPEDQRPCHGRPWARGARVTRAPWPRRGGGAACR